MLEEIVRSVAMKDWEIPEIMNCLYHRDVAFDSPQSARRMKALSEWLYTVNRWSEYGYSRKDRQLPNDQKEYIAYENLRRSQSAPDKKHIPMIRARAAAEKSIRNAAEEILKQ